ncbi:MAG: FG-GAP repeat protein [Planctomycetes bacterium]|nr:FG-GAP repeat protein [Planctomycetota bacterium]
MNQDGFDDIVVGAFFAGGETPYDDNGRAYVFAGPDGAELWRWEGELFGSYFGFSVAGPGDVTGDGVPDVAVGAYGYRGPAGYGSGRTYAFSGATGERVWYADGEAALDTFGYAIAGVGDIDADGLADIVAGADWHDGPSPYLANAGRVYVFAASHVDGCECFARVDTVDAQALGGCLTGPSVQIRSDCECSDFTGDGAVDLRDVALLQQVFGLRR